MSFDVPNYTQLPNFIIDQYLDKLTGLEIKILITICRKTLGWHKLCDSISLSQLVESCGSNKEKVSKSVKSLIDHGLIKKFLTGPLGRQKAIYELNFSNNSDGYRKGTGKKVLKTPNPLCKPAIQKSATGTFSVPTKEREQKETTTAPSEVVVYKSLDSLNIPLSLKIRLSKDHSELEVDRAVRRTLAWKGRKSDQAAVITAIRNSDSWEDEEKRTSQCCRFSEQEERAKYLLEKACKKLPEISKYVVFYMEDILVKIGKKCYVCQYKEALFEENFKYIIGILYEHLKNSPL